MSYKHLIQKHAMKLGACLLLCLLLLLFIQTSGRSPIAIKSEKRFEQVMARSELAVVMFYEKNKTLMRRDKMLVRYVKRLEDMFLTVSSVPRYKEAGVMFLMMNVDYDNLGFVAQDHGITQLPAILLFEDGEVRRVKGDNPSVLVGNVSPENMRTFIDDAFGSRIERILKDKAKARREASYYRSSWGGWGFGWGGSPYYYWNYPYYGYYGPWWW